MDFNKFATNKTKEQEGVWEDLGDGSAILVGRTNGQRYINALRKLPRSIRAQMERGNLPDEKSDDVICGLFAKGLLFDWKGMTENGNPVEYSVVAAKEKLLAYPEFREFVWSLANDLTRYRDEDIEETTKNS